MRTPLRKTLRIRQRKKGTTWCGPSVLSAIVGKNYEYVHNEVNKYREGRFILNWKTGVRKLHHGETDVRGMLTSEMSRFLRDHKLNNRFYDIRLKSDERKHNDAKDLPTLAQWLRQRPAELRKCTMVVTITGHYILVRGCKVWDNATNTKGVSLSKYHRRKARVHDFCPVNPEWKKPETWTSPLFWSDIKKKKGVSKGLPKHLQQYNNHKAQMKIRNENEFINKAEKCGINVGKIWLDDKDYIVDYQHPEDKERYNGKFFKEYIATPTDIPVWNRFFDYLLEGIKEDDIIFTKKYDGMMWTKNIRLVDVSVKNC